MVTRRQIERLEEIYDEIDNLEAEARAIVADGGEEMSRPVGSYGGGWPFPAVLERTIEDLKTEYSERSAVEP